MLVIFISKSENIDFKATFLDTLTIIFVKSIVRETRKNKDKKGTFLYCACLLCINFIKLRLKYFFQVSNFFTYNRLLLCL